MALNLANSYFRRRAAERRARQRIPQTSAAIPSEDLDEKQAVRQAVSRLPRRQRTAIILRFYADMPVVQVAELMDCSKGTVKALTHQALANLRLDRDVFELREVNDAF